MVGFSDLLLKICLIWCPFVVISACWLCMRAVFNDLRQHYMNLATPGPQDLAGLQRQGAERQQTQPGTLLIEPSRLCNSCEEPRLISEMISLAGCSHGPETCRVQWFRAQLNTVGWENIGCPTIGCGSRPTHNDVRKHTTPQDFELFDQFSLRSVLGHDPEWMWYGATGCESGQYHTEGDMFTCSACGYKMCVGHQAPWHEGETCEEYGTRIRNEHKTKDRDQQQANEATIRKVAKPCPGCQSFIEKNDCGDHMTCTRCRYEFCWLCLVNYSSIRRHGNSAHKKGCSHYRPWRS